MSEDVIREARISYGVEEAWEGVHVSATENSAYYYSTYNAPDHSEASDNKKKVMILEAAPTVLDRELNSITAVFMQLWL